METQGSFWKKKKKDFRENLEVFKAAIFFLWPISANIPPLWFVSEKDVNFLNTCFYLFIYLFFIFNNFQLKKKREKCFF